ncbi:MULTISPECIES: SDR family oxidoreductase [Bradyrhizobium]|jgi:nucleoside-diphosphate-sugar epimerase|uniref:Nucleoside-diphosphate-sugar epimerase n=1 Tax=Bradyrhizobium ottawaense TaxID=931866 RepID=A0ABV4FLT1_9BRAD|nr:MULTISPECIES: SDR family oxidoreductase [Bradyrhizobium]MBR1290635.1 SDR family oxidoreductase [Bradyrhizobium ottawaense]MDA9419680.1 epimerase [Bradyrhizobium sp. CCBAU 25360]MDA9480647.1 epimerase [Bradyrhizobium sp. CCBAU 11445]PDT70167.1 NAD(P)-dependent oxidoreductase [Bradyrhizobium ottawaense]WLB44633.1 SDR family oxidoreductase [Bradyrhizobium ottawaense]
MRLFILGLGYSARHFVRKHGGSFSHIAGTVRDPGKRDDLAGIEVHAFSGEPPARETVEQVREADVLLISIPPGSSGDPAIAAFGDVLATGRREIVYLSTIGVYGDHGGGWVDESTPPQATLDRARMRVAAEQAWMDMARGDAAILRLAGIYGPGRNALATLRGGTARRVIKPGQVFNRIHVDDIANAIMAAIPHRTGGIWNVCDDEPAPPQDVIAYAAKLMGVVPPPEEAFATAEMSAMARSFYASSARVSNAKLKRELGVTLVHPTYRRGLDALWHAGEAR